MTEKHLDQMVRDADPYRPEVIGHLDGAKQNLLEEIMSEPSLDRVVEPSRPRAQARQGIARLGMARPGMVRRIAGALAAAAVLACVLPVSIMLRDHPDDPRAAAPTGVKAAEDNPRLLIDQSGWKVTTVYGFADQEGSIAFSNGAQQLDMTFYPADRYNIYYTDRLEVSAPEPVTVDSWPGDLFRYSASDFEVMLRPRDGVFVGLRTGGAWTRDEFDRILAHVVRVDVHTWLAALPPEIVTPARVDAQAARVLADVPLPPNFDIAAALGDVGTNDAYQFGAQVTSRVGCAWIAEWLRAKQAGDDAALRRGAPTHCAAATSGRCCTRCTTRMPGRRCSGRSPTRSWPETRRPGTRKGWAATSCLGP
jgi:hypothetical protein